MELELKRQNGPRSLRLILREWAAPFVWFMAPLRRSENLSVFIRVDINCHELDAHYSPDQSAPRQSRSSAARSEGGRDQIAATEIFLKRHSISAFTLLSMSSSSLSTCTSVPTRICTLSLAE